MTRDDKKAAELEQDLIRDSRENLTQDITIDEAKAAELEQLVSEADRGGRDVGGIAGAVLGIGALCWTFFQLWFASPIPFSLGFGIFNESEARSIHLGTAMFLGFLAYPMFKKQTKKIPFYDWALALLAGFCGGYLYIFYQELAYRPGLPTQMDIWAGALGVILLFEVTRRALGAPMAVLAIVFVLYCLFGPYMPEVIAHRGYSVQRLVTHMWSAEGAFGVATGVSVSYIFIFVLLGALLDRCGGGNYLVQVSFALLGHLRGGPAKVAVVSSAVNGIVSASSVANVVTGGIFTIPLMKKAGYGGIRAGAIETAASVDGQIMPPVMGAAAFLMIEYVGIPYTDVIKHAILPAVISYISLFYIVHLEAMKLGIEPMIGAGPEKTFRQKVIGWGIGISSIFIVLGAVYYIGTGVQALFGKTAVWVLLGIIIALYLYLLRVAAKHDDLAQDISVTDPVRPEPWPTVRAGLFFLIPIGILVWCLSIEQLSAGLSAFYAVCSLVVLMLTQRPLFAFFRNENNIAEETIRGIKETLGGLEGGARNMIGIAVACGTAGVIVGAISLTGLGLRMTAFVELVSMGNVFLMLLFTGLVCLILGLGMPTTANYILMATLMAPVIVELGAQSGLIIPLIAVHMFVFYFGLMADITPPVGLATFAAAAISGEDPIKTGIQGFKYAMRTVILPFIFVFNPLILLIGIENWWNLFLIITGAIIACLAFAAATLFWFRTKSRWYETLILLIASFMFFRPDWYLDRYEPEYLTVEASEAFEVAAGLREGGRFVAVISGMNVEGDELSKTVAVALPTPPAEHGDDLEQVGRNRLQQAGVSLMEFGGRTMVSNVRFGSVAAKQSWQSNWDLEEVLVKNPNRPSEVVIFIPGMLLIAFVWWLQGLRLKNQSGKGDRALGATTARREDEQMAQES